MALSARSEPEVKPATFSCGLGDGDLGLDGLAAALEVLDVAHELVVHLAHLLGVGVCSVIGLHELGARSRKLLLLAKERAGIALVASGQGLLGEPLHAGDLGLVVVNQAAAALLLGNDAGGLLLDLASDSVRSTRYRSIIFAGSSAWSRSSLMLAFTMVVKRSRIPISLPFVVGADAPGGSCVPVAGGAIGAPTCRRRLRIYRPGLRYPSPRTSRAAC